MRRCQAPDCGERAHARGLCSTHYARWLRRGDASAHQPVQRKGVAVLDRISQRVLVIPEGCWIWQGALSPEGYGHIHIGPNVYLVHRAAWEAVNGPLPEGHHAHHRCENRACCNHEHVEPMPASEHMRMHRAQEAA